MPWFKLSSRWKVTAMVHINCSQIQSRTGHGRQQDIVVAKEEDEALTVVNLLYIQESPYGLPVMWSTCKLSNVCPE
eukprot:12936457-Prorocentrum_lima.AAC.1